MGQSADVCNREPKAGCRFPKSSFRRSIYPITSTVRGARSETQGGYSSPDWNKEIRGTFMASHDRGISNYVNDRRSSANYLALGFPYGSNCPNGTAASPFLHLLSYRLPLLLHRNFLGQLGRGSTPHRAPGGRSSRGCPTRHLSHNIRCILFLPLGPRCVPYLEMVSRLIDQITPSLNRSNRAYRVNEGNAPGAEGTRIGDKFNSLTGGRMNWLVDGAQRKQNGVHISVTKPPKTNGYANGITNGTARAQNSDEASNAPNHGTAPKDTAPIQAGGVQK